MTHGHKVIVCMFALALVTLGSVAPAPFGKQPTRAAVREPDQIESSAKRTSSPYGDVAICAVVKDQHRDIREWIEYHRWIGVSKIYLYDNNSTVPLATTVPDYLHSGLVEYSYFAGKKRERHLFSTTNQAFAYNDCIVRYRGRHKWLAFIDADEFIVLRNNTIPDITLFMSKYERYGGLALNWIFFGSAGHVTRPKGGVLVNYVQCFPLDHKEHKVVKVIANTKYLKTIGDDPHHVFYLSKDKTTVNENFVAVKGAASASPSHTKIALHHYLLKSEEEYKQKMARGSAAGNQKTWDFFVNVNAQANQTCPEAVPLGRKCCLSTRKPSLRRQHAFRHLRSSRRFTHNKRH